MVGERLTCQALELEDFEFLNKLYLAEHDKLVSYARCLLNADIAEDLVQDAFLLCTLKIETVRASENPAGWMYLTLRNLAKNERRKLAVVNKAVEELGFLGRHTASIEDSLSFSAISCGLLNDDDWSLLYEYFCKGTSCLDLSKQQGVTEAACRMRISRAKKALKKSLQDTS